MENLFFCLNATVPIFLMMVLGMLFQKTALFDRHFVDKMNQFVFLVALPALQFQDISAIDFREEWDMGFILFCFFTTLFSILTVVLLSFFLKDKRMQGEFVQASYRSSAAILGISFIQNIYGNTGMAPLMIVATVPLYNIAAVIVLSLLKPEKQKMDAKLLREAANGVIRNPIIIGIVLGAIWSLLELGTVFANMKLAFICSWMKLVGFTAVFLPVAIWMGFTGSKLVAILVMLGSSTTVSCFVMAKNMGHAGTLTMNTVMITTFFSAFTLTGWLYLLKSMGLV